MKDVTNWITKGIGVTLRLDRCLRDMHSEHQHVQIWNTADGARLFCLDDFFMTDERDQFIHHENLVHPNALAHPEPERALVIGGGDGGTVSQLLRHASIKHVHLVELDRAVVDLARLELFAVHRGALDDGRVSISFQDGSIFTRTTTERYDLIVLDISDNLGAAAPLYTVDFYRSCRRCLKEGGLLSLHVASPQLQPERFRHVIANLKSVFPIVRPYLVPLLLYGGMWSMASASVDVDAAVLPRDLLRTRIREQGLSDLAYYNEDVHYAQFALPNSVRRLI